MAAVEAAGGARFAIEYKIYANSCPCRRDVRNPYVCCSYSMRYKHAHKKMSSVLDEKISHNILTYFLIYNRENCLKCLLIFLFALMSIFIHD